MVEMGEVEEVEEEEWKAERSSDSYCITGILRSILTTILYY